MKAAQLEGEANSFEVIAREWFVNHSPNWSKNHADRRERRFKNDIYPWIGSKPVAEINAKELFGFG